MKVKEGKGIGIGRQAGSAGTDARGSMKGRVVSRSPIILPIDQRFQIAANFMTR
jgi:hypothetical protein